MKKAIAGSLMLFLSFILVLTIVPGVAGQSPPESERVFRTGFVVRGEFLDFFDRYGGIETFGYPLTIQFEESGLAVQYFHRGRMELHPENSPGQRVELGHLGELLIEPEPPLADFTPRSDSQFFTETGHTVTAAFLSYFGARGGVDLFGYPITEMLVENGRIVQYFQRARLEWHPDNPPGLRVQVGRLGEIYLDQFPPPPEVRQPAGVDGRIALPDVTSLEVVASVSHPFAGQSQPQTLFVFVYDQESSPVAEANVSATIHLPDRDQEIALPETNELGLSWQTFDVGQAPVGETVAIEIVVSYRGVEGTTETSFVIWL